MDLIQIQGDRILEWLEAQSQSSVAVVSVLLIAAITIADYRIETPATIAYFYTVPVFAISGRLGARSGVSVALLTVGVWLGCDLLTREYSTLLIPIYNSVARFFIMTLIILPFAALKESHAREQQLARQDPLTNLLNRRAFEEVLQAEIDRVVRYPQPIGLLYADVDRFKAVNDKHGHLVGDKLLIAIAAAIRQSIRNADRAARLGGDEFAVLLVNVKRDEAEKVRGRVNANILRQIRKMNLDAGISIGLVVFESPPLTVEAALKSADKEMYAIKWR